MAMNTDATMPRNNERSGPSTSYSHHANRPKIAAAAAIFGLFAWWLYEVDGPERSLLRGMVALVFLLGTGTRFTDATGAAIFLGQGPCRFALIDARSARSFVERANAIGLHYALSQRVDGYNISIGRPVVLNVFRSTEKP